MAVGTYISIITLSVNGLNPPTKRHRLAAWIQKQDPHICCLHETHFRSRRTYRLKVRGWKKVSYVNRSQKKEQQYLYQTKQTLKTVTGDKEGWKIMSQTENQ